MRSLFLILMAGITGCSGCASTKEAMDGLTASQLREMSLRLEFRSGERWGICSGTAVAADAFDTAVHCTALPLDKVNGRTERVVRSERISVDRVRIWVSGAPFKSWAKLGANPDPGDRLRWWGQPQGIPFVYREGRVAMIQPGGIVIDATICRGDSGSGLFDDAGKLVAVVSGMNNLEGCTFMVAR